MACDLPTYHSRPNLISCMWGTHGPGATLRTRLREQCEQDQRCEFVQPPKSKYFTPEQIVGARLNSTFCIEPAGDTTTRKGIVDAMSFGCIPVIFPPMDKLWLWHVGGDWSAFAVVLDTPRNRSAVPGIFDTLARIPPEVVSRKRERLAVVLKRLALGLPGELPKDHDDWLTTILKAVFVGEG